MRTTIPYVIEDMDRHGTVRLYFRRARGAGSRKVRLHGKPGTPEFLESYKAAFDASKAAMAANKTAREEEREAEARIAAAQQAAEKKAAGPSVEELVENYYASAEFTNQLSPATQRVRKRVLNAFCRKYGEAPARHVKTSHVKKWRDEWLWRRSGQREQATPAAANHLLKYLKLVFDAGIESELCDDNPIAKVKKLKLRDSEGHHSWAPEEVKQYEAHFQVGTSARLAMSLLLYTGQRRSDIVRHGRRMIRPGFMMWRGQRIAVNWLHFTQRKNEGRAPIHMELPIIPPLQAIIDASPTGDETFLVTSFGKPFTSNGFGNWFRERCDGAGLPHCSAHGLRKATASRLAELGCSDHEIMATTGHKSLSEVQRYTRAARRKRLAASAFGRLSEAEEDADE